MVDSPSALDNATSMVRDENPEDPPHDRPQPCAMRIGALRLRELHPFRHDFFLDVLGHGFVARERGVMEAASLRH